MHCPLILFLNQICFFVGLCHLLALIQMQRLCAYSGTQQVRQRAAWMGGRLVVAWGLE